MVSATVGSYPRLEDRRRCSGRENHREIMRIGKDMDPDLSSHCGHNVPGYIGNTHVRNTATLCQLQNGT